MTCPYGVWGNHSMAVFCARCATLWYAPPLRLTSDAVLIFWGLSCCSPRSAATPDAGYAPSPAGCSAAMTRPAPTPSRPFGDPGRRR